MRLRPLFLVGSIGALACSAPPATGPDTEIETETSRQSIIDGYEDNEPGPVVGVGISIGPYSSWHCSGTLIAPNLVLTARHCVSFSGGGDAVICGETGFDFNGGGSAFRITPASPRPDVTGGPDTMVYAGTSTVRHVPGGDDLCGSDVALIILDDIVPPDVAIPMTPRIDLIAQRDEPMAAAGFGLTDPTSQVGNNIRMRLDSERVSCVGDQCWGAGGNQTYDSEFQSTAKTCPGDSGGPAIDADGKVIGVLSRGPQGCLWSLYGDVGSWGEFIIETAIEAAEIGEYDPPFWTSGSSVPPEPGDACDGDCGPGLTCVIDPETEEGTCVETCSELGECPDGLECDVENGICVDPETLVEEEEPEEEDPGTGDGSNTDGTAANTEDTHLEGGCSVSTSTAGSAGSQSNWGWIAALAALGLGGMRRRRASKR